LNSSTKWLAVGAVAAGVTAALILKGAGPTTAPQTTPANHPAAVAAPATKPAVSAAPLASSNDNSSNRNRSGRRNRGGRSDSSGAIAGADPYSVLQSRSIFVKGNQTVASDSRPPAPQLNGPLSGRPEASLVFNGVIIVNDEADAMVEDLSTQIVTKVRTGDPIAGGRVSGISFDDLAYSANGRTLHVAIGQNLEGVTAVVAPPPPTPAAVAPAPTPTPAPAVGLPIPPGAEPVVIGNAPAPGGAAPDAAPSTPGKWDFTKPMPSNLSPQDKEAFMKARHAAGM
jgi:hypothetical protein